MLVRDPRRRSSLEDIMNHVWLTEGEVAPIPLMPLIHREHISKDDNLHIVQKMVDGKIATKEEILQYVLLAKLMHQLCRMCRKKKHRYFTL